MKKEVFISNRHNLMESLEDNSVVILFAGKAPYKSADEKYQFTPNRNFYYFTGIDEEEHILFMKKTNGKIEETLFIKEIDEVKERWIGKSIRPDKAKEVSGIKNVKFKNEMKAILNKAFNKSDNIYVYLDLNKEEFDDTKSIEHEFARELRDKYPSVIIRNVYPKIIPLRKVKCKEEVDNIQKAIDITIKGVENIMNNVKAGMKEYELEAYFEFTCRSMGTRDYAFKTIAASGKNATILHYVDNNSVVKDNDLILFDLGAQYKYYNGDITRTFPINGKFTERQTEVYNAVFRVNEKVIKAIKPGVKFQDLNKQSKKWIAEECMKLGIIKKEEEVTKYYWHSIGHSLGLDTHDVDTPDRDTIFKEGMVWTVEPGIYIEEESIGIRIEDDVLVTSDGVKVLTDGMIKTVEEIEEFMKRRRL